MVFQNHPACTCEEKETVLWKNLSFMTENKTVVLRFDTEVKRIYWKLLADASEGL